MFHERQNFVYNQVLSLKKLINALSSNSTLLFFKNGYQGIFNHSMAATNSVLRIDLDSGYAKKSWVEYFPPTPLKLHIRFINQPQHF